MPEKTTELEKLNEILRNGTATIAGCMKKIEVTLKLMNRANENYKKKERRNIMADTLNGNPEWKDEIPDEGYELEDKESKTDHERLEYLEKVVKSARKIQGWNDSCLFPAVAVEDYDVGGKHGAF